MEKLNVRKCVVVSVGFYPGNAKQALVRAGPVGGDVVFLVNSEPRVVPEEVLRGGGRRQPTEAMEVLRRFVNELDSGGVEVVDVWLDPRDGGVANSVAGLRSLVEGYAPCRVIIGMAGGFRWLSVALMFLALALSSVGRYVGVAVDSVFVMLEEESPSVRALFRNVEERVIPWPVVPRLADLTYDEYRVLKLIGSGMHRAKDIHGELNRDCKKPGGCVSMATVQRILVKLIRKGGLIGYEKRGKAHYYGLKPLGLMLVGVAKAPREESQA